MILATAHELRHRTRSVAIMFCHVSDSNKEAQKQSQIFSEGQDSLEDLDRILEPFAPPTTQYM